MPGVKRFNDNDNRKQRPIEFFTFSGSVLFAIVQNPESRMVDIAKKTGKTVRWVFRTVVILESLGLLQRNRRGRNIVYDVNIESVKQSLRNEVSPLFADSQTANDLVDRILSSF